MDDQSILLQLLGVPPPTPSPTPEQMDAHEQFARGRQAAERGWKPAARKTLESVQDLLLGALGFPTEAPLSKGAELFSAAIPVVGGAKSALAGAKALTTGAKATKPAVTAIAPNIAEALAAASVQQTAPQALARVMSEVSEVAPVPQQITRIKKPAALPPFEFAPIDDVAKARMAMFGSEQPIRYRNLPPEARPQALTRVLQTQPAAPGEFVGVTIQPSTGQRVIGGQPGPVIAGKFPNSDKRTMAIPRTQFSPRHIEKFYEANRDVFAKDEQAFVGGWVDNATDTVYLDVSKGFPDVRKATKFAETQNPGTLRGKPTGVVRDPETGLWPKAQKKVFVPDTFEEPDVGNSYEFLSGLVPDSEGRTFRERIREMADVGKRAMHGEDPHWWDIRRTERNPDAPIPRVYGEAMLEPSAGYIATMSPQNDPVNDMQMASEYIRRHIKGEPVVQPEWRAPATAMGPQGNKGGYSPKPGMKFPNEKFYAINANRVREGRYDELTQDKVNDMYHALMGEDVAVLDRHWAKLGDDPASGVYTAVEKNVIQPSMSTGKIDAYPVMYNAERDEALAAGVPISQHSAWVWEGIRKTIRETGKLFGQKHVASAVPDTTTGFNEIFEDLLRRKASHLGITVEKLESLLRSGDAELLGTILATPVGAAAYHQWKRAERDGPAPTRGGGGL